MLTGLRHTEKKNLKNDILSGVIIGLVSIPISMGYAQIAGLPAIYGLYGSVLPVLIFALFTSSPQFIFGVDAAPAALIGGVIASLGITAESAQAIRVVPLLTFYVSIWLMLFYIFKADRLTEYVSMPVMGGFISGICSTIILMQVPKLFGGTAGTGELHELVIHIVEQARQGFNKASFLIGVLAIAVILLFKRLLPKFPMPIVIMLGFAMLEYFTGFSGRLGIQTLPEVVNSGDNFHFLDFGALNVIDGFKLSLTVAIVIMAESLLAENNFALRNNYKIAERDEILSFSMANLSASLIGCCPVNGSVSRTSMNEQYGGKSQSVSVVSAITMCFVVLFCVKFIKYLPVPVLVAIVICALLGAIEFELAKKLAKINKKEFVIFICAFLGVLIFGTIYGVIIGVVLSFVNVILRESDPPRAFLGVVQGRGGFFNLASNPTARPIENAVIYRFSANLFFANVKEFREDIEASIDDNTKCVIVDSSGICNIDTTGAETLESIYKSLKARGIGFYLAEHNRGLNAELRRLGLGYIIDEGSARRTISSALRAEGFTKPYPLQLREDDAENYVAIFKEQLLHEFEWAFGEQAEERIERFTRELVEKVKSQSISEEELLKLTNLWEGLGSFDEDLLLESLEMHLDDLSKATGLDQDRLAHSIEERREEIYQFVKDEDENVFKLLRNRRHEHMHKLRDDEPKLYERLHNYHEEIVRARESRDDAQE